MNPPQEQMVPRSDDRSRLFRVALLSTLGIDFWFIWGHRFLPLQDYPDWIYQGHLFSLFLRGELPRQYSVLHYPVPYSTPTILLGILNLAIPPEVAGKLVLTLTVALFVLSSVYVLTSFHRSEFTPVLYVPLLYGLNRWFFQGMIAYLLGLGIFFLYVGYLFRRIRRSDEVNPRILLVVSILIYFTHIGAYLDAIVVTAVVVMLRRSRGIRRSLVLPFIPSLLLLGWYLLSQRMADLSRAPGLWRFWSFNQFAGGFVDAFAPFQTFLPWLDSSQPAFLAAALANLAAGAFIAGVCLSCVGALILSPRTADVILVSAIACIACTVFAGYSFALYISPGARFMYPAAWIALLWVGGRLRGAGFRSMRRITVAVICVALIAQWTYLSTYVRGVTVELGSVYREFSEAPSREKFCVAYERYFAASFPKPHRPGLEPFLPSSAPVVRLPYYLYIERGSSAPIFPVGMLRYSGPGEYDNLCSDALADPKDSVGR